jgi:hypothetical protein
VKNKNAPGGSPWGGGEFCRRSGSFFFAGKNL